jgi:DNA-binding MurR/RpiR family transcriptional regulator
MSTSARLVLAIQERYETLAPSERKLASLLLEQQQDMLTYTATELASMAGVSKATAARLFRSLGYRDFNEVRLQAREERNQTQPFEQSLQPSLAATTGIDNLVASHLQAEIADLTRTFEAMRNDTVAAAADLLAKAPRLWLLGIGPDEGLVRHLRPLLARVRPDVQIIGTQSGAWAEDLAMTGPRDALLLAVTAPRTELLKQLVSSARTTRVSIVTVTDMSNAAWAKRVSQVVLPCYVSSSLAGTSASAVVSMLHLLMRALISRIGKSATHRASLIADIRDELGDAGR